MGSQGGMEVGQGRRVSVDIDPHIGWKIKERKQTAGRLKR